MKIVIDREIWSALVASLSLYMILSTAFAGTIEQSSAPVQVIFDTDMASDCDDCGALAVLNKLADLHEADILACIVDSHEEQKAVAASISAINTYYGRPDIPIGVTYGPAPQTASSYASALRDHFPQNALPDDKEPPALQVYRHTLASSPDASVTIISVGYLSSLRELLESGPDGTSTLSGADLIHHKVKLLVVMGGQFPASNPAHGEFNFAQMPAATRSVIAHWPTPILFCGSEIGSSIITGTALATAPVSNPVRRAYELSFQNCLRTGRPSWDLTAVLAAVRDPHLYWNLSTPGQCEISPGGADQWRANSNGSQTYLIQKMSPQRIAELLNQLMSAPLGFANP